MMADQKKGGQCLSSACRYAEAIDEPSLQHCGTSGAPLVPRAEEGDHDGLGAAQLGMVDTPDAVDRADLGTEDGASSEDADAPAADESKPFRVVLLDVAAAAWATPEQIALQQDCDSQTGLVVVRYSPLPESWTSLVAADASADVSGHCCSPFRNRCCMSAAEGEALASFSSWLELLAVDLERTCRSMQVTASGNQDA